MGRGLHSKSSKSPCKDCQIFLVWTSTFRKDLLGKTDVFNGLQVIGIVELILDHPIETSLMKRCRISHFLEFGKLF